MQRHRTFWRISRSVGVAATVLALVPTLCSAQSYTIMPIDPLPGGSGYVWPTAINNHGTVVGFATTASGATHGIRWTRIGGTQDLGDLDGGVDGSSALDINDQGVVAGFATDASGRRAVLWRDGVIQNLGAPSGATSSEARGINALGQVAGVYQGVTGSRGFLWQANSGFRDLGVLNGYAETEVAALNDNGQVVGTAVQGAQLSAFRWSPAEGMLDLGDLPTGAHVSYGDAINNKGYTVGHGNVTAGDRAVLWRQNGPPEDMGVPAGGYNSYARGINERGQIVGDTSSSAGHKASIWYQPQSGSVDLNTQVNPLNGWHLVFAYHINDVGQIVGLGFNPLGQFSAFILNPIPEAVGFWPNSPDVGPAVFIFGSGFVPGETQMSIGGVPTTAVQWVSGDMLIALRPSGVTRGEVVVTTPFGNSTAPGVYGDQSVGLSLSAIWPNTASAFEFVFVFGSGFSATDTQVSFNGSPVYAMQVLSESLLIFMVPQGTVSGPVEVRVNGESAISQTPLEIY